MQAELRPQAAAGPDGDMHAEEGFGDVWADDCGDDGDGGWAGGDFAGFAAGEEVFVGDGAGAGSAPLWAVPEPAAGAAGLTPLAGGLTPLGGGLINVPARRPRMKVRFRAMSRVHEAEPREA